MALLVLAPTAGRGVALVVHCAAVHEEQGEHLGDVV